MSTEASKPQKLYRTHLDKSMQFVTPTRVYLVIWLSWIVLMFTPPLENHGFVGIIILAIMVAFIYMPLRITYNRSVKKWLDAPTVWHIRSFRETFNCVGVLSEYLSHGQNDHSRVIHIEFREYPNVMFKWTDALYDLRSGDAVALQYRKFEGRDEVRFVRTLQ